MELAKGLSSIARRIVALAICAACSHGSAAYRLGHPADLTREGFPSPVLEATLAGKPARLLVDTGAGVHALARWFAKAASLQSFPLSSTARDSMGREVSIEGVETTLRAGVREERIAAIVVDFPPFFEQHRIAGLLSPQLLAHEFAAAVLDQRAGTLRFDSFESALTATGAAEIRGARVCAEGSVKPNRLYVVPVMVAGRSAMLELDTGAARTTLKSGAVAAAALGDSKVQGRTMGVGGEEVPT